MRVLLVEDDPFLYKVLMDRLRQEGFDMELATDGEDAIRKAVSFGPEMLLLDLILPKKSGFEVLEELRGRKDFRHLPVVVLSNLGQKEDVEHMKKLWVREYLIKADYSLSEIVAKIKHHSVAVSK